jgi:multidrug efflux system membrane fusion protein
MNRRLMILSGALALSACPALAQRGASKVVVAQAVSREMEATVTLVATVEPFRRSRVAAELPGLVLNMPGRQGDRIEAGGLICQLDDRTLVLRLAEEQAKLDSLRARHEELLAGTRRLEIERLTAIFEEAVADFERWDFELNRVKSLYQERDSNAKEYQDALANFRAAERRKIGSKASLDLAIEGPRKEELARAAADVAAQQAVVDRLAGDVQRMRVRAPFSGVIVQRLSEVGEWVPAGGEVVEMIDLDSVLVRVDAPEFVLAHLRVGRPASVRIDALKRSFDGEIKHIIRQAQERARTFPVEIKVKNPEGMIASGMFARCTVPAGSPEAVVAVPKDAIVERDGVSYIAAVIPDGKGGLSGVLQPVTLGAEGPEYVAVTSGGLRPGTSVITRGTENMLPFPQPVIIVDDLGTPVATPGFAKPDHPEEEGGA